MKEDDPMLAAISRQLYKYYDIELDIDEIIYHDSDEDYYTVIADIVGSTEKSLYHTETVRFKKFPHTVENLDLFDGFAFIKPTTTQEQQNAR